MCQIDTQNLMNQLVCTYNNEMNESYVLSKAIINILDLICVMEKLTTELLNCTT